MDSDHSYEIQALDDRAEELERELRSLKDRFGYVDHLDSELERIRSAVSDADDKADAAQSSADGAVGDARSATRSLKQLTARVQAMEAHLADAGTLPRADFDTVPAVWRELGERTCRGRAARAELLTTNERIDEHRRVQVHREAVERRTAQFAKVLDTAKRLAVTAYGSSEHVEAAADWHSLRAQARHYVQQAARSAGPAKAAEEALAADEVERVRKASLLEEGEEAEQELRLLVRSRIADAIRDRALLPMWFVTVLGPVPPSHHTEDWLDTAVSVLTYRIVYGVTDQALALGGPPQDGDGDGYAQEHWREQLLNALKRW